MIEITPQGLIRRKAADVLREAERSWQFDALRKIKVKQPVADACACNLRYGRRGWAWHDR